MSGSILNSRKDILDADYAPPSYAYVTSWNYSNNSNVFTFERNGLSKGKSWHFESGSVGNIISDFDTIYPWSDMKLCNMDLNGNVLAYYGDENFTWYDDGVTLGNVMVEIPKFYYRIFDDGKQMHFMLSPTEKPLFHLSPRHRKIGSMTKNFDKIYVGAFNALLVGYHCATGSCWASSNPISSFLAGISNLYNNFNGWYQMDYPMFMTIMILKIVELGTFSPAFKSVPWTSFMVDAPDSPGSTKIYTSMNALASDNNARYRGVESLDNLSSVVGGVIPSFPNKNMTINLYMDPSISKSESSPNYSVNFPFSGTSFTKLKCGNDEYDFLIIPENDSSKSNVVGTWYWNDLSSSNHDNFYYAPASFSILGFIHTNKFDEYTRAMYLPPET